MQIQTKVTNLFLICLLLICIPSIAAEVSLTVLHTDTPNGLVIHGETNLPTGTKLGVRITDGGQDYKIFVKDGKYSSVAFTDRGMPLAGKYEIIVFTFLNSLWQNPEVLTQLNPYGGPLVVGKKIEKVVNINVGSVKDKAALQSKQSKDKKSHGHLAETAVNLLMQGKQMDGLRSSGRTQECGDRMRVLQPQAEALRNDVSKLPGSYEKMLLGAASSVLTLCVSCSESLAMDNCREAEGYLREAGIL